MIDKKQLNIIARISKIREAANSFIEQEILERGLTGIVPAHGSVFAFLFQQDEPIPITALVKKTGRAKSTVTGIVKTLERHGYVFRQENSDDARSCKIGLTDKGLAIKHDFEDISSSLQNRVYNGMPSDDREQLAELLEHVEANLLK